MVKYRDTPFLLKPVGKDYLWGGSRLRDDFGKNIEMNPLAESWECSTHPDGISVIGSGKWAGRLLSDVLAMHPEYMGEHPLSHHLPAGQIPILVKLIDAKEDLSVQVHPDDEYALKNEGGQLGKTEMWYIVDADKDARIVYGLKWDMSIHKIRESILSGKLEKYLRYVHVEKNDVFYIKAGRIHAIGAGTLVAEIQENSNLTYRLYDYDRTDKSGQKRELNLKKALETADLAADAEPKQPLRVLKYKPGYASEFLCRCKYFQVERIILNTEGQRHMADYSTSSTSFHVLLCMEGCGGLYFNGMAGKESISFFKGDCVFVPANSGEMKLHGVAQILNIFC